MKLEDFETVTRLVNIRKQCEFALEAAKSMPDQRKDSGGVEGFREGYAGHVSLYPDGSGPSIDLSGCYVMDNVIAAVAGVLEEQIYKVDEALAKLGVDVVGVES